MKGSEQMTELAASRFLRLTTGVRNRMAESKDFAEHVIKALEKFSDKDWGDVCAKDRKKNDKAVLDRGRVLAAYGEGNDRVWIIKDGPVVILFPGESAAKATGGE